MWFLDPSLSVFTLALLSFWCRTTRWRRIWLIGFLVHALVLSSLYIAYLASKPLEEYRGYPRSFSCDSYTGVIALGGVIPNEVFNPDRGIQLNSSAERVIEPAHLYFKCPNFKLVFSSFGKEQGEGIGESELARDLWVSLGVPKGSILIENFSTNTRENAVETAELLNYKGRWLLVTSASHMRRAVGSFERVGLEVEAAPVDYLFSKPPAVWSISPIDGISIWKKIIHEYVGLIYYKLRGWLPK